MNRIQACYFIPVCISDKQRILWTIESIRTFCSDYMIYVLIDGIKNDFEGIIEAAPDIEVIYINKPTNRHWGLIWRMQNNGMLHALKRDDLDDKCIFVKIDADAIIVRNNFISQAQQFFNDHPKCGQVGQVYTNIVGLPLPNKGWNNYFKNRIKGIGLVKLWVKYLLEGFSPIHAYKLTHQFKNIIITARKNGYFDGCFAIGGSYMLRKSVIEKMEENDFLLNSPLCFIPDVGEDVLMTPHVYYVGYEACDCVGENGLFAIYGQELLVHPLTLKEAGNYIIHPLKHGYTKASPPLSEEEAIRLLLK